MNEPRYVVNLGQERCLPALNASITYLPNWGFKKWSLNPATSSSRLQTCSSTFQSVLLTVLHNYIFRMGCILSFFRTLTSYHGSHLSEKQRQRQRKQRLHRPKSMPERENPPTPIDSDSERLPCTPDQQRQLYFTNPIDKKDKKWYPYASSSSAFSSEHLLKQCHTKLVIARETIWT